MDGQLSLDDTQFLADPLAFIQARGYEHMPVATLAASPVASHWLEPTAYCIEWVAPHPTLRVPRYEFNRTLDRPDR